ncbi:MAG: hypothetical protein CFE40_03025 [Burkholderiales bacterium PBB1]|nr:MAG: hypothetical protein CFE40_03025 [Burkholderiales bacterium PBB1]
MPTKPDSMPPQHEGTPRSWWTPVAGLLAAGLVTALVACGGGGGSSAGVGTGGTGAFAVGTISGFGSVIVNGVRYDDSGATIDDDDDGGKSSSSLAIGQVVEIRGSVNSDGLTGTASSISYYSALKGPVTAVNAGAGTLTVFGQVVNVTPTTLFANVADLSAIAIGNVVEVYGLPDASGGVTATRIEREALTIGAFSGDFRIRGVVSGLVATSPGQRFTVGTVTVQTDNATQTEGTVIDGAFVKVRLNKTVAGDGSYLATRVKVKNREYESGVNKAEVQGLISEFTSSSAPFKVNGYPVQLDTTVTYEHGAVGDLANNVRIEAKGVVTNGVLVVTKVEFDNEDNDGGADGSDAPYEFHGVATCTACGSTTGSFEVRGVTVQYDTTTRFENSLTPGTLNGARVEVKAIAQTGSSGTTLLATRIELDN